MNERIKKLRKALDLTQREFGERLGVKGNTIAQYEIGRNEPGDAVLSLICREFNVREEWLREGTGEMFKPAPSAALDVLAEEYGLSRGDYVLVEKFVNLKPEMRAAIAEYVLEAAAAIQATSAETAAPAAPASDKMSIDEKVELYRRELEREEKAAEKSEVS